MSLFVTFQEVVAVGVFYLFALLFFPFRKVLCLVFFFLTLFNVYLSEREREKERESGAGAERERERGKHRIQIRLQALSGQCKG